MSKRDNTNQPGQSEKVRKTLRGRAEKACVRCRAKKRTCDGGNPCQRCKESHSACYFSDWHYAVPYPREYVEYLEEQQEQLSKGLLTMHRLLKESNVKTIPALPDPSQAQDLLAALRDVKLDHRPTHRLPQVSAAFGKTAIPYEKEGDADSSGQLPSAGGVVGLNSTSPIQPSVFPPLYGTGPNQNNMKPTRLPPRGSSFLLPPRQSEPQTMPMHPRMASDPCISVSSSADGGASAFGPGSPMMTTEMAMPMPGTQWPYTSRPHPANAQFHVPQGYLTPLTPSPGALNTTSDNEAVQNWTWMYGSEFGLPGEDGDNGRAGDIWDPRGVA